MSEYDRSFARRHITWKVTDVKHGSLKNGEKTPNFTIFLSKCKTEWFVEISEKGQLLAIYLHKTHSDGTDFSIRFSAAVMKMKPNLTYKHSRTFIESCDGVFREISSGYGFRRFISLDDLFNEKNQLLVEGVLTVEIQLELIENSKVEMLKRFKLLDNYEKLINNEKYSDFVFVCSDGEKVHVHKPNIAVQCDAFASMIDAGLSETATCSANIADVDSPTMIELVRFLYSGRVKSMETIQEKLVIAANKYGLEDLKNLCVSSMMETLTDENVVDVFEVAELLGEEHLKSNCIDYIKCHHFRLQNKFKKEDLSKELSWALWKSMDLDPIRIWFINNRSAGLKFFADERPANTDDEENDDDGARSHVSEAD